ncbi:MAG: DUF5666 domain-containing protein [Terriglobia bacterium]
MTKRAFFVFSLAVVFGALSALAGAQSPNTAQGAPPQGQANGQNPGTDRRPGGPRLAGTVTSVGVDRFEIKAMDGSVHTILVDDQTRYRESQKDIQLEDLKAGDHVMVMGKASPAGNAPDGAASPNPSGGAASSAAVPAAAPGATGAGSDQTGFTAATVRRMTEADLARSSQGGMGGAAAGERVFGEIVSIDNNQLKVRNARSGDQTIVVVDAQTTFLKDNQPIALKDLKVGDRIFAVGKTANGQFAATRVITGQMRGGGFGRQRPANPEN